MGDERALVPPTRERKREERRARVLSIRAARLATLSALTWTTLSVVATTGTLAAVIRDRTVRAIVAIHALDRRTSVPLFFFSSERRHDATSTVVATHRERDTRLDSSSQCGKSPSSSQIRNTYYTDLSKVSEFSRSLARTRAVARACVSRRSASIYSTHAVYNPATTTPRRATRSTDTGQNGARHCPATPTLERAGARPVDGVDEDGTEGTGTGTGVC